MIRSSPSGAKRKRSQDTTATTLTRDMLQLLKEKRNLVSDMTGYGRILIVPDFIDRIADEVFMDDKTITQVHLQGVRFVGARAFKNCTNIAYVTSFGRIELFGSESFANCHRLAKIEVSTNDEVGAANAFGANGVVLANSCFYNTNLRRVQLPENAALTFACFASCRRLAWLHIPPSIERLPAQCFCNTALEQVDGKGVESLGDAVFQGCDSLRVVDFPKVSVIPNMAFADCISLRKATFGNVESVGDAAFYDNSELAILKGVFQESLRVLRRFCFRGCRRLSTIDLSSTKYLQRIEAHAFGSCMASPYLHIGPSVIHIGDSCFKGSGFMEVTFKASVSAIPPSCFEGCHLLRNFILDVADRIDIGERSFALTGKIRDFDFHAIKEIDRAAFIRSKIEVVHLPRDIVLKERCFMHSNVTRLVLDKGLTEIPRLAFGDCVFLQAFKIPSSVRHIGESAFRQTLGLDGVTFEAKKEEDEDSQGLWIGSRAFEKSSIANLRIDRKVVFNFKSVSTCLDLVDVSIARPCMMGSGCFSNCKRLQKVHVPQVVVLGPSAFHNCYEIPGINLPRSLRVVGDACFRNCRALANLQDGKVVKKEIVTFLLIAQRLKDDIYLNDFVCSKNALRRLVEHLRTSRTDFPFGTLVGKFVLDNTTINPSAIINLTESDM